MSVVIPTPVIADRAAKVTAKAATGGLPSVDVAASLLPDGLDKAFKRLSNGAFWRRILTGIAGAYLIYWGLLFVLSTTKPVKDAIGVGVSAASKGLV